MQIRTAGPAAGGWLFVLAVAASLLFGPAKAQEAAEGADSGIPEAPPPSVPESQPETAVTPVTLGERGYKVSIEGTDNGELRDKLEESSQLVGMTDEPPASLGGLRRRAKSDLDRLQKVLRSEGYYSGTVAFEIEPGEYGTREPAHVILHVNPGERYLLGDVAVNYVSGEVTDKLPETLASFGAPKGSAARAASIVEAEGKLVKHLRTIGYPYAKSPGRQARANVDTHKLNITTDIALGPLADFGPLTIKGLERVDEKYVRDRLTWTPGQKYDANKVADLRNELMSSGLFNAVRIEPDGEVGADGTLPMVLTAGERAPRTIGAGGRYSSTEGFGLTGNWEHRNLFGEGESIRLELDLSQQEQRFTTEYRVPFFRRPDQKLVLGLEAAREDTDVYERTGGVVSAGVERVLSDLWTARGEVLADIASVDEAGEPRANSYLIGVHGGIDYDSANSTLDPTRGFRASLDVTPYAGYYQGALAFTLAELEARHYLPLDEDRRFVFATRGRIGSIFGASTAELPADKRFFAGGAGSVRGFEYQEIGPLDDDGNPEGGRSVAEVSAEMRWRITESIGIVPFVDGGTVSDGAVLDFNEEMAWAGGLGLRYYTSFGPIGIDLAYPISTPSDEEPSLHFYVKLGQAF